jgi:hypothetical protein
MDLDGAIDDFNQAIGLKTKHPWAYYCRGFAREAKKDIRGAIADYQMYLKLGARPNLASRREVVQRIRDLKKQLE